MKYEIIISKPVQKQIDKLPTDAQPRLYQKIQSLSAIPRPDGVLKMKGYDNEYRVRVGNYRIRYEVDDSKAILKILHCGHRKDVYKAKD